MRLLGAHITASGEPAELFDDEEKKHIKLVLKSKTAVSSDTFIYRFSMPRDDLCLGLPAGQHIGMRFDDLFDKSKDDVGDRVQLLERSYTPISLPGTRGYTELLIKHYPPEK